MHKSQQESGDDVWLANMRDVFSKEAPALLGLFDIYAAEAQFGRRYIDDDLISLPYGAKILEIGAGSLLLSVQLVREGFQVTALEPVGTGFSHFDQMREIVLKHARKAGICPKILSISAEELKASDSFSYIFSVNVMEHVADVDQVLENVGRALLPGAIYRFTCPNYLFPYEPHFNIPTLFSKNLTEKVFNRKIFLNQKIEDPLGTWNSLNWINVIQVSKLINRDKALSINFDRKILVSSLERITTDPSFAGRRSNGMRRFLTTLTSLGLHRLFGLIPACCQPIMDCRVEKRNAKTYI